MLTRMRFKIYIYIKNMLKMCSMFKNIYIYIYILKVFNVTGIFKTE